MREASTDTLSPGTWIAQLGNSSPGVTAADHHDRERPDRPRATTRAALPDPGRPLLPRHAAGAGRHRAHRRHRHRSSCSPSSASRAPRSTDWPATLGDSEPAIATLRTENAQRTRTVRTGGDDLGGAEAYEPYDALTDDLTDGIDQQLATNADDARRSALVSGGIVLGALLATIILAFLVSRLLLKPDPQGARGRPHGGQRAAPRGRRPDPRR